MEYYQLDAARYLTAPSLAWDTMLLHAGVELELLTEDKQDIYRSSEDQVRGGLVQSTELPVIADDKKNVSYIDANNLYSHAISGALPTCGHIMLSREEINDKI